MGLFEHVVHMTTLYTKTSDPNKDILGFLEHTHAVLELWRSSVPLHEQQATIDAYNAGTTSPYVSLWLFENEKKYGWGNTFPTSAFHACVRSLSMIVQPHFPLVLQRMEQAVVEHDTDFFNHWSSQNAARMFRRLLLEPGLEDYHDRAQNVLIHLHATNTAVFEFVRLSLPKDYVREQRVALRADEFLANDELLEKFKNHSQGLGSISLWEQYLDYAKNNIQTLSSEMCEAIYNCWIGRQSRFLSGAENLHIADTLATHYSAQFETLFPLFFDLEGTQKVPTWQVQAAVAHAPKHLPGVAGVLAERYFFNIMGAGAADKEWRENCDFYDVPGVRDYLQPIPLVLDLKYTISNSLRWKNKIHQGLHTDRIFPHPGLEETALLLLDFAGGPPATYPKHAVFHNHGIEQSVRAQEFEHLLQKRKLEQDVLNFGVSPKGKKM